MKIHERDAFWFNICRSLNWGVKTLFLFVTGSGMHIHMIFLSHTQRYCFEQHVSHFKYTYPVSVLEGGGCFQLIKRHWTGQIAHVVPLLQTEGFPTVLWKCLVHDLLFTAPYLVSAWKIRRLACVRLLIAFPYCHDECPTPAYCISNENRSYRHTESSPLTVGSMKR
jgi:hypothetical protein